MGRATKSHILDDRYLLDACKTVCFSCKHIKCFAYHICAAYPDEIPPEYWNREKKVPEDGKKERTITKKHTTQKIPHAGEILRVLFCALR